MKKKKILLLTSIASIATFSAAAIIFSSQSKVSTKADPEINYYSFDFTANDCNAEEPDYSGVYFTLKKENVLLGEYDISTTEETWAYFDIPSAIDFTSSDSIFEINQGGDVQLYIYFKIIGRATIKHENSYVNVYVDDNYVEDNTFYDPTYDETHDVWDYYYYSYFTISESFRLESVHLEFSCEK